MPKTSTGGTAFGGIVMNDSAYILTPYTWSNPNHSANKSVTSPNYNVMQSTSVSSLPVGTGK